MDDDFDAPDTTKRMTFFAAAMWTLGMGFAASIVTEITESARPGAGMDLVNLIACRVAAVSIFLFVMLRVYAPHGSIRDVLGVRDFPPLVGVLGALAGGLLAPGISLIDDVIYKRFPLSSEETELVDQLMTATTHAQRVILFVSFAVIYPISDELFFRGIVFRGIRRGRPEGLAVLGTAMLYGLSHMDPRALPTGLVAGLLVSWLRGRSGSVFPAMLANVAICAVPLVPTLLGRPDFDMDGRLAAGGAIGAGACAWAIAFILAHDGRAEHGRLLDA